MNWIDVKDKLPEFEKDVLLFYKSGESTYLHLGYLVEVRDRNNSKTPYFNYDDVYDSNYPTHWCAIPDYPLV
jgi:hypothetical protein